MIGQSKPLYELQRKLTYQRHVRRLQEIQKKSQKKSPEDSFLKQMHKIRNKSTHFRTVQHQNELNHKNSKIINSILTIAKRKSQSAQQQPSMFYFNNRVRKRQQKQIQRTNLILAQRILTKHSDFDPTTLKKNIDDYQQRKRRRERNKKISLPQLERSTGIFTGQKRSRILFADQEDTTP